MNHPETHNTAKIGWLRAAVLGANDGIVSITSLIVGVAAAHATQSNILVAGVAGLIAGAMSMAAGEYVSVSSQADTESADIEKEKKELREAPESELQELTQIYIDRGLDADLAAQVAIQFTAHDALAAHARDELGISEIHTARPIQAALASAAAFAVGGFMPMILIFLAPPADLIRIEAATSLIFLALLGGVSAYTGGAKIFNAALRVTFWGALAMLLTNWVGSLFGTAV